MIPSPMKNTRQRQPSLSMTCSTSMQLICRSVTSVLAAYVTTNSNSCNSLEKKWNRTDETDSKGIIQVCWISSKNFELWSKSSNSDTRRGRHEPLTSVALPPLFSKGLNCTISPLSHSLLLDRGIDMAQLFVSDIGDNNVHLYNHCACACTEQLFALLPSMFGLLVIFGWNSPKPGTCFFFSLTMSHAHRVICALKECLHFGRFQRCVCRPLTSGIGLNCTQRWAKYNNIKQQDESAALCYSESDPRHTPLFDMLMENAHGCTTAALISVCNVSHSVLFIVRVHSESQFQTELVHFLKVQ